MKQKLGFQFSIHYTTHASKLIAPGIPQNLFQCEMAVSLSNATKSCKGWDVEETHYHSRKKKSPEYTYHYIIQHPFITLLQKGFHLHVWWQIHLFASSLLTSPTMYQIPTFIVPIMCFLVCFFFLGGGGSVFKKNSNIYPSSFLSFIFTL